MPSRQIGVPFSGVRARLSASGDAVSDDIVLGFLTGVVNDSSVGERVRFKLAMLRVGEAPMTIGDAASKSAL